MVNVDEVSDVSSGSGVGACRDRRLEASGCSSGESLLCRLCLLRRPMYLISHCGGRWEDCFASATAEREGALLVAFRKGSSGGSSISSSDATLRQLPSWELFA